VIHLHWMSRVEQTLQWRPMPTSSSEQ